MRYVTSAGQTVLTTDDIASALLQLAAKLSTHGRTESISIPVVHDKDKSASTASILIGRGQDLLSLPAVWDGSQPDFTKELQLLEGFPLRLS